MTKLKEFLAHLVGLTKLRAGNDTKTYDYDTIDSRFSTITNYDHKFELRFISKDFKDAFYAYEAIEIFELSEHDTTYDVRLAIDNYRNLDQDGGYFSPPSFDDPMSEDEKEAFFD